MTSQALNIALVLIFLSSLGSVLCIKNCSYPDKARSKVIYRICTDDLVCCESDFKRLTELEGCCYPPEYQLMPNILPVRLTLKNLAFILFLFIGIIIAGALFICFCMLISKFIEKEKEIKPIVIYEPIGPRSRFPIYNHRLSIAR